MNTTEMIPTVVEHEMSLSADAIEAIKAAIDSDPAVSLFGEPCLGYYAACGRLSDGRVIEMAYVAEWNGIAGSAPVEYIRVGMGKKGWRRRFGLDGKTADLANYLRGRRIGSKTPACYVPDTVADLLSLPELEA